MKSYYWVLPLRLQVYPKGRARPSEICNTESHIAERQVSFWSLQEDEHLSMPHPKERRCSRTHVQTLRRTACRYDTLSSLSANRVPTRIPKFEVSIGIFEESWKVMQYPKKQITLKAGTDTILQQKKKKRKKMRKYKARSILFCSDYENLPACFLQYTWHLVRGTTICTPTFFVDRHNSSY